MGDLASDRGVVIVVPVFNDWVCVEILVAKLAALEDSCGPIQLVLVDDGSTDAVPPASAGWPEELESVTVLRAGANLGHQRAIALGLAHVAVSASPSNVVVIDSDGEDDPAGIPLLLDALRVASPHDARAVVAQRAGRSEAVSFKVWYRIYKWAFRVLTGRRLDFGNFCALTSPAVRQLTYSPDMWNHFPAALMRSRIPIVKIPLSRSTRFSGRSHMNFVSLVNHGLSAVATFSDVVFARLLIAVGALVALLMGMGVAIASVRIFGSVAIPGWATVAMGFTLVVLFQFLTLLAVMTFIQLSTRSSIPSTPRAGGPLVHGLDCERPPWGVSRTHMRAPKLELFSDAHNWRRYWASQVSPYLGSDVLEVGAGIGSVTRLLRRPGLQWTALEPDEALAALIDVDGHEPGLRVVVGTLAELPQSSRFDTILYIDVLEHIEHDRSEAANAARLLHPGGTLVVLAPAHNWLYSEFDASIGHYRRYSRGELRAIRPEGLVEVASGYLDSVGILASSANKLLLRSGSPTRNQIRLWDRRMVPVSRHLDRLFGRTIGKSVFVVWRKPAA